MICNVLMFYYAKYKEGLSVNMKENFDLLKMLKDKYNLKPEAESFLCNGKMYELINKTIIDVTEDTVTFQEIYAPKEVDMKKEKMLNYIFDLSRVEADLWKYLSKQFALCDEGLNPTKDCKRIHRGIMRLINSHSCW